MTGQPPDPRHLPPYIQTLRLLMRPLGPGDGPALFAAAQESREHVYPFMPVIFNLQSVEEAERLARRAWIDWWAGRAYRMALWRRKDGALVGTAALHHGRWDVPRFELGCWIHAHHAGHGFATEATRALIALAFEVLGVQRLEIRCDHRNLASQRVAEKLGFTFEGRLRAHNRAADGVLVDEMVYALLADETIP
ncbi:MAG: GNAT family N-acetyltransferase [Anaerolineae bacterium]